MSTPGRAFITGISGQDGSYLAERLLEEGVEVHALAHELEPLPDLPGVELHRGDLTDIDRVRALLLDLAPEEVYNLAAISSVARSWEEPDLTAQVNGLAAGGLLESARQVQDKHDRQVRFVQASSAEIFGDPDRSPQDESTAVRPVNPYGAAKAFAHLLVDVYRRRGLHAVSAILYNHESPRRPTQFVTRKITSTVAAIVHGDAETLTLGNLDARRDWGWAPDYVDALVRAARADQACDYVVATGVAHSVRDFVAAAFGRTGITDWKPLVSVDPGLVRPADPTELVGDPTLARERLGWSPSVGFDELVGRMVDADLARLNRPAGSSGSGRTRS
ncbi:GDP-mannose 4,6-dehydratase [Nocardioides sp.]|uniref:GDP-mannose 4,6-dehydratase n=1 Tax=Nocardioides sp. TaxID=35761 RepID=UPI0037850774